MKELNKFRQFINEGKENVDELFGLRGKPGEAKKAAKALDALEKALFELNFLDILGPEDYEDWLIKYEKLRGRVMAGLEDSDRKKYDVAYGSAEGDLDENDAALDEIINEAKPNLKKALPTIAARNVERNNLINADIEDMMDMVGGAGKGEGSEEAEILFKASNASDELEQALTDLQMYFEDDLGEGKESLNEEYSSEQEKAFDTLVHRVGQPNILIARRYSIQNNMGAPTLGWAEAVERGRKGGWFKNFWPDNLIKILAGKPDLNSKDGEALQSFFSSRAGDIKNDALRSAKIFNDPKNKPDATEKLLVQDYESLAKAVDAYVKAFKA